MGPGPLLGGDQRDVAGRNRPRIRRACTCTRFARIGREGEGGTCTQSAVCSRSTGCYGRDVQPGTGRDHVRLSEAADLGLSDDEIAFYDALGANDTAVQVPGDETLKLIAHELVETVKRNTGIDWTVCESVRARLRVLVRRILRRYGYPPDKQEQAVTTVLQQAELFADSWAA